MADFWAQFQPVSRGFLPGETPGTPPPPPGDGSTPPPASTYGGQKPMDNVRSNLTGSAARNQFRDAWFAYAQQKPPDVTYVDWLKKFVGENPQFGATITGSKGSKILGPNGEFWAQAIRSAGINGGVGTSWDEGTDGGDGMSGFGGPGFGDWAAPYTGHYSLPTEADLEAMPGFQAGRNAYVKSFDTGAAAKGTLLTMGNQIRRAQGATDYTQQAYGQLAGLQGGAFDRNYNIFRNNQNDPYQKFYGLAQLGRPS